MLSRYSRSWMTTYTYCNDELANGCNIREEQDRSVDTGSIWSILVATGVMLVLWLLVTIAMLGRSEKASAPLWNADTHDRMTVPRPSDGIDIVLPLDGTLPVRSYGDHGVANNSPAQRVAQRMSPRVPHPDFCTPGKTSDRVQRPCRCLDPHGVRGSGHVLYFCLDTSLRTRPGGQRAPLSTGPARITRPIQPREPTLLVAI